MQINSSKKYTMRNSVGKTGLLNAKHHNLIRDFPKLVSFIWAEICKMQITEIGCFSKIALQTA